MTTRNELAKDIDPGAYGAVATGDTSRASETMRRQYTAGKIADALIAERWRKVPSREAMIDALAESDGVFPDLEEWSLRVRTYGPLADGVLALMEVSSDG